MAAEQAVLAEYASLRNEIIGDQSRGTNVFTFTITIVPAVLGLVAAGAVNPYVYLTPLLVIFPSRYYLDTIDKAIYQKSRYIREEIEGKIEGLNWERHFVQVRKHRRSWYGQTFSIGLIYTAMTAVSLALFVDSGLDVVGLPWLVLVVLASIILLAVVCVWMPVNTHRTT